MTVSPKITGRQRAQKKLFLEQLGKTPIVSLVAEKTGIPRSTYYRWLESDMDFRQNAEKIYAEGVRGVNDMATSQLLKLMKDGDRHALMFWLRMRDPEFGGVITRTEKTSDDEKLRQETIEKGRERLADMLLEMRRKKVKESGGDPSQVTDWREINTVDDYERELKKEEDNYPFPESGENTVSSGSHRDQEPVTGELGPDNLE